jgi:IS5 family transposase
MSDPKKEKPDPYAQFTGIGEDTWKELNRLREDGDREAQIGAKRILAQLDRAKLALIEAILVLEKDSEIQKKALQIALHLMYEALRTQLDKGRQLFAQRLSDTETESGINAIAAEAGAKMENVLELALEQARQV